MFELCILSICSVFFLLMTKWALEKHLVIYAYLPKLAGFQELNLKPIQVSVKSPKYFRVLWLKPHVL